MIRMQYVINVVENNDRWYHNTIIIDHKVTNNEIEKNKRITADNM